MLRRFMLVVTVLVAGGATEGWAQRTLTVGDTVRVLRPGYQKPDQGVVQDVSPAGLDLCGRQAECINIPSSAVLYAKVLNGRRPAFGRGAAIGGIVGMASGVALGMMVMGEDNGLFDFGPEVILAGAVVMGVGGLAAGAVIGSFFTQPRWTLAELPPTRLTDSPRSAPGLGLLARMGAESTVLVGVRLRR
jgi:hypothetical protein